MLDADQKIECVSRSAVHMKMRSYKEALQDANAAVEADGSFAKGYLRRAAANEALEIFDDAVRDYEKVCLAVATPA